MKDETSASWRLTLFVREGACVIWGSRVAATKMKEWTLARTVTEIKIEENMMVVKKS